MHTYWPRRNNSLFECWLDSKSWFMIKQTAKCPILLAVLKMCKSRDSSVGIALGYGLDDRGSRVRFPRGLEIFLFTTTSRTALGPTQPPIQWVPGALSLGVKQPGREADHSPPSSTEVKECVELYLHSPQYAFMAWCLVKHRDNFTFTQAMYLLWRWWGTGNSSNRRLIVSYLI
jgi:hypothetical protein